MPFITYKRFVPPNHLKLPDQLTYSIEILEKHRKEAIILRKDTSRFKLAKLKAEKEAEKWKEKYLKRYSELQKLKQQNSQLEKDKKELEKEIERITKTNSRYQVSLFDHGNFKHPDQDGDKKNKGGQKGHIDTNRENQQEFKDLGSYDSFERKRLFSKNCGKCGFELNRVSATKEKILLDIVLNPQIIKLIIESERQWCGSCKHEVNSKDSNSLPFSEYGLNTFLLIMILRFKCHCSMASVAKVIEIGFGLKISASNVSNILKQAAKYLGPKYEQLKQAIRRDEVMYCDETGWLVKGQKAWMWIMTTENKIDPQTKQIIESGITVYVAAESRGGGIAKDLYGNSQNLAMTDGLKSYLSSISKDKHLYCWAHVLRFAYEETVNCKPDSMAVKLREELVRIYHIKFKNPQYDFAHLDKNCRKKLRKILTKELDKILSWSSEEEAFQTIQNRVKEQKIGLVNALLYTPSGTNNLAERELRPMALNRNVSFGSNTYTGMETTAIVGSVVQTLTRNQQLNALTELTLNLQIGMIEKYPQYAHLSYSDST